MAGQETNIIGAARVTTINATIAITSQNGMFDSAAWTRTSIGNFLCTLSGGTEAQNGLDNLGTCIFVTAEQDVQHHVSHCAVVRTSATGNVTTFRVINSEVIANNTVTALADPPIGFSIIVLKYNVLNH